MNRFSGLVLPAGPGPAKDHTPVRLQRRHVGLLLNVVVSSAAAATIVLSLVVLCSTATNRQRWYRPSRLLRSAGSQDQLLLLGILLSSSSVLISGLDGSSVPDWMFEIFCSVSRESSVISERLNFWLLHVW